MLKIVRRDGFVRKYAEKLQKDLFVERSAIGIIAVCSVRLALRSELVLKSFRKKTSTSKPWLNHEPADVSM